jgi:ribonuclease HII
MDTKLKELDTKYQDYVGIDEAGRGNLAGSLIFVGATLKEGKTIEDIAFADDSKSMSKKKREELYNEVIKIVDYEVVETYASYIDNNGLSSACSFSLTHIKNHFKELNKTKILYDGKTTFKVQGIETLVKADAKVSIVAAASIIAKVEKDKRMKIWDEKYPMYDWKNNAGYGTKGHIEAIKEFGWTEQHRRSFNVKALEGLEILEVLN